MNSIKKNNANHATVCANKTCVTVYGDTARFINELALATAAFIFIAALAKALR